jgi:predicted nucleic acid-binding protein
MNELCIDASVVVKLVFKGEPLRNKARQLVRDCVVNSIVLIAPPFFVSEVDTAVRKRVYTHAFTVAQGNIAYSNLDKVAVKILTVSGLRQRARVIAEQFNQRTVYDATYAALADLRGCEFWTADKPFYDAVKAGLPFVRYLANYP